MRKNIYSFQIGSCVNL